MRRNLFLRYLAETRATVAITFSLASIPLLLAIGGAVDHARAFSQKSALQKAADAAVLAAAGAWRADPELTTTDLNAIAEAIFHPNVENAKFARQGTTNFQLTAVANSITAQVTTTVPTTFLKLAGLHEIRIAVESQAPAPPFDGEIAFVLDHSNSMTGTKHTKMLDATTELLDKLTASGTNNKVKISLVPFAGAVYVSLPGDTHWMELPGIHGPIAHVIDTHHTTLEKKHQSLATVRHFGAVLTEMTSFPKVNMTSVKDLPTRTWRFVG